MYVIPQEDRVILKTILAQFKQPKSPEQIFYHMCFCLCTPQTTFKKNKIVLQRLKDINFYTSDIKQEPLSEIVREVRFKNNKARWILEAKKRFNEILDLVSNNDLNSRDKRNWLIKNINGFGMKTASHFLRNLGCTDLAIIDTHIIKFLHLAHYPSSDRNAYELVEKLFIDRANEYGLSPVEFDAYIWKTSSDTPWSEFDC